MTDRNSNVLQYLSQVTRGIGGPGAVIERLESLSEGAAGLTAQSDISGPRPLDHAREAIAALESRQHLQAEQLLSIEALINSEIRPAIDIVDGTFSVEHRLWKRLSEDSLLRTRIETAAASVGRIELPGNPRYPYGGTGFVVGSNLLMTNRHVAEIFAAGIGDRRLRFLTGAHAGVDFLREHDRATGPTFAITRIVMIHPYWDMALLETDALATSRSPLQLSLDDARDLNGRQIFIIGYPAFDYRNPTSEQDKLFGGRYGIKRLQPGELHGAVNAASYGKTVRAAGHDCSTLGGNSGSAVFDLDTGQVLALHFGGAYQQINYSVPSASLARDARVVDAGVSFSGRSTAAPDFDAQWWLRADALENSSVARADDGVSATAAQSTVSSADRAGSADRTTTQVVTIDVPVRITVSVTAAVGHSDGRQIQAGAAAGEALREPDHDTDYTTRRGYDEAFLDGDGSGTRVPLPQAVDVNDVARTIDGELLLVYQNFSIAMHRTRRLALYTASNVTREPSLRLPDPANAYTRAALSGLKRNDQEKWFLDPRIDIKHQLPDVFFTKDRQAFDKGHIVRRDDIAWGRTYPELLRANGDSYHVTNCSPQVARFNRSNLGSDNWGSLENHVLKSAATERLCVFAGPVLRESDETFVGVGDSGSVIRAKIPSAFWKIVVARTVDGLAAYGFVLQQDLSDVQWEYIVPDVFKTHMCKIAEIAAVTKLLLAPEIVSADQYFTSNGVGFLTIGVERTEFN